MEEDSLPKNKDARLDPIGEIVRSLHERDEQRQKAIQGAWTQLEAATTEESRLTAINNIARMLQVSKEFHGQFPEIFPPDET